MKLEIEIPFLKKRCESGYTIKWNFLCKVKKVMFDMGNYHENTESEIEDVLLALFEIVKEEKST